jgi:hypothetical protein
VYALGVGAFDALHTPCIDVDRSRATKRTGDLPESLRVVADKDRSVIGFDNIPETAHSRPGLTTIEIGGRQIGEEAANRLLRRIKASWRRSRKRCLAAAAGHWLSCGAPFAKSRSNIPS